MMADKFTFRAGGHSSRHNNWAYQPSKSDQARLDNHGPQVDSSRCRPSSLAFLLFGVLPRSVQPACKVHWLGFTGFFGFVDVQYTKACSSRCCFVCYFGLTEAQTFPVGRSTLFFSQKTSLRPNVFFVISRQRKPSSYSGCSSNRRLASCSLLPRSFQSSILPTSSCLWSSSCPCPRPHGSPTAQPSRSHCRSTCNTTSSSRTWLLSSVPLHTLSWMRDSLWMLKCSLNLTEYASRA
jgi:hypothetical protein